MRRKCEGPLNPWSPTFSGAGVTGGILMTNLRHMGCHLVRSGLTKVEGHTMSPKSHEAMLVPQDPARLKKNVLEKTLKIST